MRREAMRRGVLLLAILASLAGCGTAPPAPLAPLAIDPRALPAGDTLLRTELIFGRARPDGSVVSEAQWQAFVDQHVAPRFAGFTVFPVTGQYRDRTGRLVREDSFLVLLLHEPDAKSRAAIEEVRAIYKRLFDQETVPLVTAPARVSF
jgi:Protein of unknown function (DUF3574)